MRRTYASAGTAAAIAAACLALGCAPRLEIVLAPEAAALKPLIAARLGGWQKGGRARYLLREGRDAGSGGLAALVSGAGPRADATPLPAALPSLKGWLPPRALARAAAGAGGSYACLPILWDCLGLSAYDADMRLAPPGAASLDWTLVSGLREPGRLALPGADPLAREALFAIAGSTRGALARELRRPAWIRDSLRFSAADLEQRRVPGKGLLFLEDYSGYQRSRAARDMRFYPLTRPLTGGQGYALAGPWLQLSLSGGAKALEAAAPLIAGLLAEDFQKEAGAKLGLLPANLAAPDPGAEARKTRLALVGAWAYLVAGVAEGAEIDKVFDNPAAYAENE